MKEIWKFPLSLTGGGVMMPKGSTVLKVALQHGTLTLWAVVDPVEPLKESRMFSVYGTGWRIPDQVKYLDTVFEHGFVWHVFEGM